VHVTEELLEPIRARYGDPVPLSWDGEVSADELTLVRVGGPGRRHDVTIFIWNADRLALIRKPMYPPGIWRTPGGGVKVDEDFVEGVRREALEETGVDVELTRYLVRARARFRCGAEVEDWQTHIFAAVTRAELLDPLDRKEIAEARWGTSEELGGPIRARLVATGRALWQYRVALHDAALAAAARDN
jgi:ADP-ribose pyrophosphatase YjhB (NUDIX family)